MDGNLNNEVSQIPIFARIPAKEYFVDIGTGLWLLGRPSFRGT